MTLLQVRGLHAGYAGVPVVRDFNLDIQPGQLVAILGPNGAGKSTTMATLAGHLTPLAGTITLHGEPLKGPTHRRARQGLAYISEERSIFSDMTTLANLQLGQGTVDQALELFPELHPLLHRRAGLLSGGEQQMLTLARALAATPQILLVDELSLGLAPLIVQRLLNQLITATHHGIGVLIIEQHARQILHHAHHAYVLQRGTTALTGTGPELLNRLTDIEATYLTT